MFRIVLVSGIALLLARGQTESGQLLSAFEAASATSTHPSGDFPAPAAISPGSAYWCSSGKHVPGQQVTWTGVLPAREMAVGVAIKWAYGPGELRVLTSAGAGNFEEAAPWRSSSRNEVSYSEVVMFASPRSVTSLMLSMRSPKTWGYFGIESISVLVEPGPAMFVSASPSTQGELCLMASGDQLVTSGCLEAVAAGKGEEIFKLSSKSQMISAGGKCVTMVSTSAGRPSPALQDCKEALEVGDGRGEVMFTSEGQLKWASNYCLSASAAGVSLVECAAVVEANTFHMAAVPEFDPSLAARVEDAAQLLSAATARQSALLSQLQQRIQKLGSCKLSLAELSMPEVVPATSEVLASGGMLRKADQLSSAMQAIGRIPKEFGFDLDGAKAVISASRSVLTSVTR